MDMALSSVAAVAALQNAWFRCVARFIRTSTPG